MRAAQLLGREVPASPAWWGADQQVVDGKYDVVLALANEYGVRASLQARRPTVLLHATTSRNWQAQLHRHVASHDVCLNCRLPAEAPRFTCTIGNVDAPDDAGTVDAAIPPLSATAGLLLAAELRRLQGGCGGYPRHPVLPCRSRDR